MAELNVKDARDSMKALLERVEAGEEVTLTRRGRPVARVVPIGAQVGRRLPSLDGLRSSITVSGQALSADINAARSEERF